MTARCGVLIGTPTNYRYCALPGDPCEFHDSVMCPRTVQQLRVLWDARLDYWRAYRVRKRAA